ncbi:MAG: NADH-quinone oxidoreductase subunit N, partial [Acidimicrobiia bacterium]|nr:NADH-quinone oxidoreductase subunit N [Acidimicrobiia bacterium]
VVIDGYGVLASFILLLVGALGLAAAWGMVERLGRRGAEGIVLVFMAIAGFQFMAVSANLVMMFMGLEIASISLYVLAGITRERPESDEAALKYFLLGSFASSIFIYGVALAFAGTGGISVYEIGAFLRGNLLLEPGVLLIGMALLIAGLAFKVSAAPFHVWAPDTYQGSPAGIVGFMASGAKVGAFAGLGRIVITAFPLYETEWTIGLAILATLSIATGTLLAIAQSDIRRLLAYSGVAHAGFILTGLTAGEAGMPAVWFYLAVYTVQLIGAFAVVAAVAGPTAAGSPLSDYEGLSRRSPFLAAVLALFMLAMSGVPLTAGFVGKFGVFAAAWRADFEWLVIAALVASVAGFFFYLRVIVLMYMHEPAPAEAPGTMRARLEPVGALRWVLIVAVAITVALGVYPTPLLDLVGKALPF